MEQSDIRLLPPGLYALDDLTPGDRIETGSAIVSAEVIDAFADFSGDDFEIHLDRNAAVRHGFSDRVAHGLLVLALVDGLKCRASARIHAQASLGWHWSFKRPVLAQDTIRAQITVAEKRSLSDQKRGLLTLDVVVTNQNNDVVQSGTNTLMCYRSI
ncbi:MAG: MaoC family dehydratase [Rhodobacteraceae bacterium]|nr:MaoC family dehydratase [Paracoccaceae bacterium]